MNWPFVNEPATCAVRGHPPGEMTYMRWVQRIHPATLGVGGHIGPSELPWPKALA